MEPKQPTPRNPEFSASPSTPETWSPDTFEQVSEKSHEQQPVSSGGVESELPMPVIPVPIVAQANTANDSGATPSSNNPLTAGDDDVIEKEWVDKAKKIINDTKGDPYRREYEVGKLQADYIEKRYGKKLGEVS